MIHYSFSFNQGESAEFDVDETAYSSDVDPGLEYPAWARLGCAKCTACSLESEQYCPAAVAVYPAVLAFGECISFESMEVQVRVEEIKFSGEIPAQNAVRSLLGLLLSLSHCPILEKLRPMARFHLPFGQREHTLFRFLGMYLIAQRLRQLEDLTPDWEMNGLLDLFDQVHTVNRGLAERLRNACSQDAAVNSVVILDSLAYAAEADIKQSIDKLKPIFHMYL